MKQIPVVIVEDTAKKAAERFYRMTEERSDIELIHNNSFGMYMLTFEDGQSLYIMSETLYYSWCKGRTYQMNGEIYRSGYPVEEKRDD